jgi:lactoylglutathione lyase
MNPTTITDVRTVAISVSDQRRAVEFYTDTLGFETRLDADLGNGMRWIEVAPPGAQVSLALTHGEDTGGVDTGIRLTATNVEADHDTLRSRGVDIDDVLRWPGVPAMFTFRDLDNNTLYVVEDVRGEDEQ